MNQTWYVQINGKARACTASEIDHLLSTGILDRESKVWTEGMPDWAPYSQSSFATPSPPPFPTPIPPAFSADKEDRAKGTSQLGLTTSDRGALQLDPAPPPLEVSDDGWQDASPSPWRRYFARSIDMVVLGAITWAVVAFVTAAISTELYESWFSSQFVKNTALAGIVTCALILPLTTLLIGLTGSSLGKWVFGVRVTRRDGRPIGIGAAFGRELTVYFAGLGFGIPLVAFFTQLSAYRRLTNQGVTSWDKEQPWVVTHRPQNGLQIILYAFGVIALVSSLIILQEMK